MQKFSYLKSVNVDYIDEVYQNYLKDPFSVEETWRFFFEGIEFGAENAKPAYTNGHANGSATTAVASSSSWEAEIKVARLIDTYRESGAQVANISPLQTEALTSPTFDLSRFGLSNADLEKSFSAGNLLGLGNAKLSLIIAHLKNIYTSTIGTEYTYIQNIQEREWLRNRIESTRTPIDIATKLWIHERLAYADGFEKFLHTRYVAQKRFSVEGGDNVIPILDCFIEKGAELGAKEFILGMAHRGRLNVLTHVMGKKPEYIFTEFEGNYKVDPADGEGDVKYHKGYSADFKTRKGNEVHLSLAFNPSHLEFVNAVVEGMTRAKQDKRNDNERKQVVPILIHGDAAVAGQGICYETANFLNLKGFSTGGTLHVVINNQVGFTTDYTDSRSTRFCTDLAKMTDSPVFHVNGDDAEACWQVAQIATEYRQKFNKDVYIDLVCYRKHGHNEGDEPTFTQPVMYKKIKTHPAPREVYAKKLIAEGTLSESDSQNVVQSIQDKFLAAQAKARSENPKPHISAFENEWSAYHQPTEDEIFKSIDTSVSAATLKEISKKLNTIPAGFNVHPKLTRFIDGRLKAVEENHGIDWGNAETLAYGSLLIEGTPVRISGQDAERGTFTHRHSVFNDFETGKKLCLLNQIKDGQAQFKVYNSHLSETGVLGFEYGYSLAHPKSLVIWEAQFGDFANGAQVIIDQFIATSESKWRRMSGLTLLLPHGYEGQGPEHSSARLERFLQLCGRQNIIVANLTTPAQIFHALRRQVKRDFRKPLVIMSPKSLLRHPKAISSLDDLSQGRFNEIIDDTVVDTKSVTRVLLCTGKIYYDLDAKRVELGRKDIAIVRIEQLYPFPAQQLETILNRYSNTKEFVWVQEEPKNMGAWGFVFQNWMGGLSEFRKKVGNREILYAGRDTASAPAVGSIKQHEVEQKSLVEQAFKA